MTLSPSAEMTFASNSKPYPSLLKISSVIWTLINRTTLINALPDSGKTIQMSLSDFDELDKRIIELLCRSSQGSYRQLAKQLDVHPTTLIQRVKNLEAKGVINGYRASIDYMTLGYEYMGLVSVYADNVKTVQDEISKIPQVISVFDVTGESDCIVWIACIDRDEFSEVVKEINAIKDVRKTNTAVILNITKDPFSYIPPILGEK
ncbi:Lrp/AsnC family transcriptional regulator [Candidatus Methanoprimaticola sp. MG2]|uniref:Lrp/AsnC family transcriptional regulator n=1 Tax=Candidatus Methanoprimaticola sp. MG2 TaxID=3228838 RepID=UPI0039C75673